MKVSIDKIDAFIFDFDGVMTNNLVFIDQEGNESVSCSRADGLAFDVLHKLDADNTEYWEGKRGACIGFFQQVVAGLGTKEQFLGSLSHESKKVACKTLDKFCSEYVEGAVHFIKIDVEGMELEVLKSGANVIEHDKPIIFVETNPDQIKNNKLVEIFMKQMSYEKINDCRQSDQESFVSKLTNDTIYISRDGQSLLSNWRKI